MEAEPEFENRRWPCFSFADWKVTTHAVPSPVITASSGFSASNRLEAKQ